MQARNVPTKMQNAPVEGMLLNDGVATVVTILPPCTGRRNSVWEASGQGAEGLLDPG